MANLGRPNLARPRMIQVEGVNKKNIQNLQKGIQQFQANQQKMAQMEEANRIKEAQIYVQSAKTALNQKKLQLEMDQFDREVLSANNDMDRYKLAQQSWDEQIANNPNVTRADIQAQLQQWLPLTNSKVVGVDSGKRIAMLQKMDEQIMGSDMIKDRNEYIDARNNGMAWDSPEELKAAVDWDNSIANNKIKKVQVGNLPDGTPDHKYINTGVPTEDFLIDQEIKVGNLFRGKASLDELQQDRDLMRAIRRDDNLRKQWNAARDAALDREGEEPEKKEVSEAEVTTVMEDGEVSKITIKGSADEIDVARDIIKKQDELREEAKTDRFQEFLDANPEAQDAFVEFEENLKKFRQGIDTDPFFGQSSGKEALDAVNNLNDIIDRYNATLQPGEKAIEKLEVPEAIGGKKESTEVVRTPIQQDIDKATNRLSERLKKHKSK